MRPRFLAMEAFGPFRSRVEIDFDRLGRDGAFLLRGPTGAGKTSILDAVCFALYGESSGTERSARELRCDAALASEETDVVLDFSVGPRFFRIRRKPEQERPKSRGVGTTLSQPEAFLWETSGGFVSEGSEGRLAASGTKRVDSEIQALLGFSAAEFRQVVLLPQGRFREFLSASSAQRQEILEALFSTQACSRVEAALQSIAAKAKKEGEESASRLRALLAAAKAADVQDAASLAAAAGAEAECAEATAGEARARAEEDAQDAQAELLADGIRSELAAAREAALSAVASMKEAEEARSILVRARAAAVVAGAFKTLQAARSAFEDAEGRRLQAQSETQAAEAMAESIRQEAEDARAEWRAALEASSSVEILSRALEAWRFYRRAKESAARALSAVEIAEAEASAADAELSAAAEIEARAEGRSAKAASDLDALLRLGMELRTVDARRRLRAAVSVAEAAEEEARVLQAAFDGGNVHRLASSLEDGSPCPVCGSVRHPSPASGTNPSLVVAAAELEAAHARRDAASREASRIEGECASLSAAAASMATTLSAAFSASPSGESGAILFGRSGAGLEDAADPAAELLGFDARRAAAESEAACAAARVRAAAEDMARAASKSAMSRGALAEAARRAQEWDSEASAARLAAAEAFAEAGWAWRGGGGKDVSERGRPSEEGGTCEALGLSEGVGASEALDLSEDEGLCEKIDALRSRKDAAAERLAFALEEESGSSASVSAARASSRSAFAESSRLAAAAAAAETDLAEAVFRSGFESAAEALSKAMSEEEILVLESAAAEASETAARAAARYERAESAASALPPPDPSAPERAEASKVLAERLAHEAAARRASFQKAGELSSLLFEAEAADAPLRERSEAAARASAIASGQNPLRLSFGRHVLATLFDEALDHASVRLLRMTKDRFSLRRRSDPPEHRGRPSGLDLEVEDSWTGTVRRADRLSGGEGFLAALAMSFGLSDAVQARAGGTRLETLFIDEGFGSLDPEALDAALDAVADGAAGRLVGLVSHAPELVERLPSRLLVLPSRSGSSIRIDVP